MAGTVPAALPPGINPGWTDPNSPYYVPGSGAPANSPTIGPLSPGVKPATPDLNPKDYAGDNWSGPAIPWGGEGAGETTTNGQVPQSVLDQVPPKPPPWSPYAPTAGPGATPGIAPHNDGHPNSALPNPDSKYVDAFNAHMGEMRQAIDNQLASSVQQLGARRDAAAAVVAGLPAAFTKHLAAAKVDAGTLAKTISGTVGGRQAIGANDNDKLAGAVLSGGNNAAQETVPLLQLGNTANYGQGLDTLNAAHTTALGSLDSTEANFDASMASSAASLQGQKDMWTMEHTQIDPKTGQPMYDAKGNPILTGSGVAPTAQQLDTQAQNRGYTDSSGMSQGAQVATAVLSHEKGLTNVPPTSQAAASWKSWTPAQQASYTQSVNAALSSVKVDDIHNVKQYLVDQGLIYGPAFGIKTITG